MYLGTYVNIQVMRICTDTCTDTTFIYRFMRDGEWGLNWIRDKLELKNSTKMVALKLNN